MSPLLPTSLRSASKKPEIIRINSPEAFCGGLNEVIHVKVLGGILVTWYSIKVIDYFNYFIIIIVVLRLAEFSGYLNDRTSGISYCLQSSLTFLNGTKRRL